MISQEDKDLLTELRTNGLHDEANALEAEILGNKFWVGQFLTVKFPALNKNSDLTKNDKYIREDARRSKCKVQKVYKVPPAVFDALGDTLLDDNSMWEKIGGQDADDDVFQGKSLTDLFRDEALLARFRSESYTNVVIVTDGKRTFAVNTEGYDYARYVGRVVTD